MSTNEAEELIRSVRSGELSNVTVQCAALCGYTPALKALGELESTPFSLKETADVFGLTLDELRRWIVLGCPGAENEAFSLPLVQRWAMENIWPVQTIPNCAQETLSISSTCSELATILGVPEATTLEWAKAFKQPIDNSPFRIEPQQVIRWLYDRKLEPGEVATGIHDWRGNGPLASLLCGLRRLDLHIARKAAVVIARMNARNGYHRAGFNQVIETIDRWLSEPTQQVTDLLERGLTRLSKTMADKGYSPEGTIATQNLLQIMLEDNPREELKVLARECVGMSLQETSLGQYDDELSLLWKSSDAMIRLLLGHNLPSIRPRLSEFRRWRLMVEEDAPHGGFMEYESESRVILVDWQNESRFFTGERQESGELGRSSVGGWDIHHKRGVRCLELSADFKKLIIHCYDGQRDERLLPGSQ
ncbi:MAG: hypothetical protein GY898_29395 [Proteobacteria bacterium]|nr:hypothetical protein [Pseudomonadota bacterium]